MRFVFLQYLRLKWGMDIGYGILLIFSFLSAIPKLEQWSNIKFTPKFTFLIVGGMFFFIWLCGYIFDVFLKYPWIMREHQGKRDPYLTKILEKVEKIEMLQQRGK